MTAAPRPPLRPRHPTGSATRDDGRAIIEVVFLAVLLLIPTVYILIAILTLQSATMAVTQAARDAGRYIETASDAITSDDVTDIAAVALRDQHVATDRMRLATVRPGGSCTTADRLDLATAPGTSYDLCVIVTVTLPGIPTVMTGSNNTVTAVYTVSNAATNR